MEFGEIEVRIKEPDEKFLFKNQQLPYSILDFWKWNQQVLIDNLTRGILAEFIIKIALDIYAPYRYEWESFDLKTENDISIEVKSSAYIQSWAQKRKSNIRFSIAPTRELLEDGNYSSTPKRQADVYIFCLLANDNQESINPLDLAQWEFYIVPTQILDEKLGGQQTLSLSTLKGFLNIMPCTYMELKSEFLKIERKL